MIVSEPGIATPIEDLEAIVAKLTMNGARNLVGTIDHPADIGDPDSINGNRRIDTGPGKWTHIASMGVERHLCSLGVAEQRWYGEYWGEPRDEKHRITGCVITPLGREVAIYLKANWSKFTFRGKQ